ncbi:MAG: lysylphosphatidylglycerol synthase domain-containing protein, partial [Candidatus Binatia bacterium]
MRLAIGVSLIAYLALSGAIDWATLLGLARRWPITGAALLLLLLAAAAVSWRLCVLCRPPALRISLLASLRLTLIGLFFNAGFPGSAGGEVVRIYYAAKGNEGRRTEIVTVMLADRVIGLFALLVWPLLAAPLFPG